MFFFDVQFLEAKMLKEAGLRCLASVVEGKALLSTKISLLENDFQIGR